MSHSLRIGDFAVVKDDSPNWQRKDQVVRIESIDKRGMWARCTDCRTRKRMSFLLRGLEKHEVPAVTPEHINALRSMGVRVME